MDKIKKERYISISPFFCWIFRPLLSQSTYIDFSLLTHYSKSTGLFSDNRLTPNRWSTMIHLSTLREDDYLYGCIEREMMSEREREWERKRVRERWREIDRERENENQRDIKIKKETNKDYEREREKEIGRKRRRRI